MQPFINKYNYKHLSSEQIDALIDFATEIEANGGYQKLLAEFEPSAKVDDAINTDISIERAKLKREILKIYKQNKTY